MGIKNIYMDNAATTPIDPLVLKEMLLFADKYGNPSSSYSIGESNKIALNDSRIKIANLINAKPQEIYFTSGGSESDNWAIKSIFDMYKDKGNHIITTKIEHHAILKSCEYLENFRGAKVTYLDVDKNGFVNPKDVEDAITNNTILISVITANNEIGTIEPIRKIGNIAHKYGILFHTDAVQAFGHKHIDVDLDSIDLLSASAHKLGGPKGIGCLYIRDGIMIPPYICGGGQEMHLRAGTENVMGIVGFGKAAEIAHLNMDNDNAYVYCIRKYMENKILKEIQGCHINSSKEVRMPGNLNIAFDGIRGEQLVRLLDMCNIYVSTGSACNSDSMESSHVLKAIGLSDEEADSSIRFSLSAHNTIDEIDYVVKNLKMNIEQLRSIKG